MTSNRLPVLASEIRKAHDDVQDAARTAAVLAASQRAIAEMVGVDEGTVRADLGKRSAENSAPEPKNMAEKAAAEPSSAENSAPAWFSDADADGDHEPR